MGKETFDSFITHVRNTAKNCYVEPGEPDKLFGRRPDPSKGWSLFCGFDERGYAIFVQKAADDREIMVRAGCRWKTLKAARAHWVSASRNGNAEERRTAKQILLLISSGVTRARTSGWTKKTFNSRPRKVTR